MELSAERISAALANAVSFAGGVLQSFADGTDEWRYQVGVVARNGLVAAELARAGSISAPHAFEGKSGFARAFARGELDPALASELGKRLGDASGRVQAVPGLRIQPDSRDRRARDAGGNDIDAGQDPGPDEPLRDRLCGNGRGGAVPLDFRNADEHPVLHRDHPVHGAPTTRRMTTYDDAAVNALVGAVELVSDPSIPILSAIVEMRTADGRDHRREQRMTAAEYAYDLPTLSSLLRRIGGEEGVPMAAFDRLEAFVENLPSRTIGDAISVFELMPPSAKAS